MTSGRAKRKAIRQVALLHKQGIAQGFLSSLGTAFLSALYEAIDVSPCSALITIAEGDVVSGFVAITSSTKSMYAWIFRHYWFRLGLLAAVHCLSISNIRKLIETAVYDRKGKTDRDPRPDAELLSIAVCAGARQHGAGRQLVKAAEEYLRRKNIGAYRVVTAESDTVSNGFYRGCGFVLHRMFYHHGIPMNEYRKLVPGYSKA